MSAIRVRFAKTEAHGNDFLLVEDDVVGTEERAALARALCDRLRGIGADGLIFHRGVEGDFAMTLYNSDGST
ncbi:MAG TPA: diaminopimelate epimerase, partial [Vicinamibacteria bacterium]|nr:diaminopimelate epimerase [Vicinamibacteria bacterium]